MTPGQRCDEIMRLIDETLEDYANSSAAPVASISLTPPLVSALRTLARAKDSAVLAKSA